MKRILAILLIGLLLLSFTGCQQSISSTEKDSQKLIGTWQCIDESWGLFEYTFYSDGYCKGYYRGWVGNVEPSLFPDSYYEGSGDGYWSFVGDQLKIEYTGEDKGSQYYNYSFNSDGSELTIEGNGTYTGAGTVIWSKTN